MALMPVADALNAVLDGAHALPPELVALDNAFHRTLAADVISLRTQPPADMSAMDGYAVRAADAALNAKLKVIGEVAAGKPFNVTVKAGEAVRIFTGGVIPDGADSVVIQEDTKRDGDVVTVTEAAKSGKNIRRAGIDFREGDALLRKGVLLSDRDLALAASSNHAKVAVHRRPKIALLATGDELIMPGNTLGPGQIVYTNGYALRALCTREGADVIDLGIAADTLEATTAAIRKARDLDVDVLVTTGGASVGDHDLVKPALEAEGFKMDFWRIAMRPGKPMMHGKLTGRSGRLRTLGLPGNPVSSYVCAFLFLVPLIRALTGRSDVHHPHEDAVLGRDLPANDQREDYLRARLEAHVASLPIVTTVDVQDSSLVGNLARANVLVIRPPFAPAAAKGSQVQFLRLPT